MEESLVLRPIGWVESVLVDREQAPKQGDEGGPDAWIRFDDAVADGLRNLRPGAEILVFTWLHRARRDVLQVYPRSDETRPLTGVFSTRSPDRPNPIGLHRVRILERDGLRVKVSDMEAVDGTPVVDVKPILRPVGER
jgi:tRNA-Thr(GGU) m(6)t(6)A37 methyltransferase TsaA